jgi:hypothetical protein
MNQIAIDNAAILRPDLYSIENLFDPAELTELVELIDKETQWQVQELQETMPRLTLPWVTDGLLDQVWSMLNQLDYSRFEFKFLNVSIWKDLPGYCIGDHNDNPGVQAAMQIYLNNLPKELGTWFDDIEIPYVQNSGYIMNNQHQPRHGMKHSVPVNSVRYSLYARFNRV